MSKIAVFVISNLVSFGSLIAAIYLLVTQGGLSEGWGWLLVLAAITHAYIKISHQ